MAGTYDRPEMAPFFTVLTSAFGGGALSWRIKGPPGKKGLVRDILIDVTTTMVGTTTVPEIVVGATAGSSEYARFRLGTTATAGYTTANGNALRARGFITGTGGGPLTATDYAGHVALETATIPADTAIFVSGVAGTGGAPAGAASVYVFIDWF